MLMVYVFHVKMKIFYNTKVKIFWQNILQILRVSHTKELIAIASVATAAIGE